MVTKISITQPGQANISGELTFATVTSLFKVLPSYFSGPMDFTVDLAAVKKCDSSSLVLLIGIIRFLKQQTRKVYFINLPPPILTLIQLYHLQELINIQ